MTTTPSARSVTCIRHARHRAARPTARRRRRSRLSPHSSATAAAASALPTWCSPLSRSATAAEPDRGVDAEATRRPSSSSSTSAARTAQSAARPTRHDPGRRPVGHRAHRAVVAVEDGDTAVGGGRQRLDQLTLGRRDRRAAAELAQVRRADVEDDADARRRDLGQVADVADAAGARLGDQEPGVCVGPQHGVRVAQLVVERAGRGDGRPEPGQHLGEQILGRGLARRAGDADHGHLRQPAQHLAGQVGQRGQRRRRPRCSATVDRTGRERPRPPRPRSARDGEVVAVVVFARHREEQPARLDLARVELDARR